jgi:hypothetical protein
MMHRKGAILCEKCGRAQSDYIDEPYQCDWCGRWTKHPLVVATGSETGRVVRLINLRRRKEKSAKPASSGKLRKRC